MPKCRHKSSVTYSYGLFATARVSLQVQINSLSSPRASERASERARERERERERERFHVKLNAFADEPGNNSSSSFSRCGLSFVKVCKWDVYSPRNCKHHFCSSGMTNQTDV